MRQSLCAMLATGSGDYLRFAQEALEEAENMYRDIPNDHYLSLVTEAHRILDTAQKDWNTYRLGGLEEQTDEAVVENTGPRVTFLEPGDDGYLSDDDDTDAGEEPIPWTEEDYIRESVGESLMISGPSQAHERSCYFLFISHFANP